MFFKFLNERPYLKPCFCLKGGVCSRNRNRNRNRNLIVAGYYQL
jgi:hypothetical protein